MIRVGGSFSTGHSPIIHKRSYLLVDDGSVDDDTASITSCESDTSTIRAMKSTVRQFDDLCRDILDIEDLDDEDVNPSSNVMPSPECWDLFEQQFYGWTPRWWRRPEEGETEETHFVFESHQSWWQQYMETTRR